MSQNLFEIIRKVNFLVQESSSDNNLLAGVCGELSKFANATIMVVDYYGKLLYRNTAQNINSESYPNNDQNNGQNNDQNKCDSSEAFFPPVRETPEGGIIESQFNDQLRHIIHSKENIPLSNFYIKTLDAKLQYNTMIFAIGTPSQRLATLVAYKAGEKFSTEEISLAEFSTAILTLLIKHANAVESVAELRKSGIVKSVIDSLSFSELKAILHIFNELDSMEGTVIASKIADKAGITRSVIVNSLRKLESAGVIESHSLGMKGTHIKVLNDLLPVELSKISKV